MPLFQNPNSILRHPWAVNAFGTSVIVLPPLGSSHSHGSETSLASIASTTARELNQQRTHFIEEISVPTFSAPLTYRPQRAQVRRLNNPAYMDTSPVFSLRHPSQGIALHTPDHHYTSFHDTPGAAAEANDFNSRSFSNANSTSRVSVPKPRNFLSLTRSMYHTLKESFRSSIPPAAPEGISRKRWQRIRSLLDYHPDRPPMRSLSWRGCLLALAPIEDWESIIMEEHCVPAEGIPGHKSLTQTYKHIKAKWQTRRSRGGIDYAFIQETIAKCPDCIHVATEHTQFDSTQSPVASAHPSSDCEHDDEGLLPPSQE